MLCIAPSTSIRIAAGFSFGCDNLPRACLLAGDITPPSITLPSEESSLFIAVELIHALPPEARRCFDRKEAASYVGVSPTTFDKLVRQGTMPRPTVFLGRKVWDRLAIDRLLDAESGIESRGGQVANGFDDDLDRELAAFEAKHGQH
jgi:excisionase family DNA binding protein